MFKPKIHKIEIEVDGEKQTLHCRELSAKATLDLQASAKEDDATTQNQRRILAASLCTAKGELYTEQQVDEVYEWKLEAFAKLSQAVMVKSGMFREAEPAKNVSTAVGSGDSPTA